MATSSALRLMSDLKTVKQQPPEGVSASPLSEENLYVWGATVFGPDDTSWEGGIYTMRLMFTEQYPDKPPRVRFTTEMVRSRPPLTRGWGRVKDECGSDLAALPPQFHPNIYPDGTLCLDLIQDNWSPIYSVAQPVTTDLAPARELGCGRTGRSALSTVAPLATDASAVDPPLAGELHPDCDPLPPDGPQLREPCQPRGGPSVPDGPEAVWQESAQNSGEVGQLTWLVLGCSVEAGTGSRVRAPPPPSTAWIVEHAALVGESGAPTSWLASVCTIHAYNKN